MAFDPDSVLRPSPMPILCRNLSLCFPSLPERDAVRSVSQESELARNDSILSLIFLEIVLSDRLSENVEILERVE